MEKGAFGTLIGGTLTATAFALDAPLPAAIAAMIVMLVTLGLTLPSAMTFALTLHRERAGAAAAILGSVSFLGGGLVAPLTSLADPRICVSIIFIFSGLMLVLIAIATRRGLARVRVRQAGEALDLMQGQ